jgi:hypothetical protein
MRLFIRNLNKQHGFLDNPYRGGRREQIEPLPDGFKLLAGALSMLLIAVYATWYVGWQHNYIDLVRVVCIALGWVYGVGGMIGAIAFRDEYRWR